MVFNYFHSLCLIAEQGRSREEFVSALGSEARVEETKSARAFKGLFGR